MNISRLFVSKEKEVSRLAYVTDIVSVYENHHYIHNKFKSLYIELGEESPEDIVKFISRFSKDYNIFLKIPTWCDIINSEKDIFLDTLAYLKAVIRLDIRGIVLKLHSFDNRKVEADFVLRNVVLKRLMLESERKGVSVYIENYHYVGSVSCYTLSDMLRMRSEMKGVKLCLNLYDSILSGSRFLDVIKYNRDLAGLSKNFDMLIFSGIDLNGDEIVPGTPGDVYDLDDYIKLLSVFKKSIIAYRGRLDRVLNKLELIGDGSKL